MNQLSILVKDGNELISEYANVKNHSNDCGFDLYVPEDISIPSKAISFKKNERSIIDNICIKCGVCINHCPQSSLSVTNYKNNVKLAINSTKKVVASIAAADTNSEANAFAKSSSSCIRLLACSRTK